MADVLTWEELLEEETQGNVAPAFVSPIEEKPFQRPNDGFTAIDPGVELPAEVTALFEERKILETRMKVLSGKLPPPGEDAYVKAKFPIKVHTKESRIEERRLRIRDDQRRVLTKQRLEQANMTREREIERLRQEQLRREETRHRWAEAQALAAKQCQEEELAQAEQARRLKESELQHARRLQAEEAARADEQRRLKESELQHAKRLQAEEVARVDEQRRLKEAELQHAKRLQVEEAARADEQRRLKESELQHAKRLQAEEVARVDEQRRLKEAELSRQRALRAKDMILWDVPRWAKPKDELQRWDETRTKLNERFLERRKTERQEERRRRVE